MPRFIGAGFRARIIGLCALAVLATADGGSSASFWRVHSDGRIGPLKIDASTEADVRHFAGTPFKVAKVVSPTKKRPIGYELYYRCGRGCVTVYAISYATRKLADFTTQSALFVSEHGSHVGMSARRAAAIEHRGACGEETRRPSALGRPSHLRPRRVCRESVVDHLPRASYAVVRGALLTQLRQVAGAVKEEAQALQVRARRTGRLLIGRT
jgi:hypothetical protein